MAASRKSTRICPKGHRYEKSSDCPVCPICERERVPSADFLAALAAPARRALEGAGLTTLAKLARRREDEVLALHGIGPGALPKLRAALSKAGLGFRDTATVEEYFAKLDPAKRAGLMKLRRTLKALLPKAEECISYGMPAFRHPDGVVAYYAAMKAHLSFFPTSYPIEACAEDLKGYQTSRGTIRFPIDTPLPASLVKKLVRVRLAQMAEKRPRR